MTSGRLEVLLLEAEGIKDREKCTLGCLNCANPCKLAARKPYVQIQYGNQEQTSSVAKGKGKKKEWNEIISFEVKYPDGEEDHSYKMVFRIMDKHKYSQHEHVGETTIHVKDILAIGAERGKLEVQPRIYRIVDSDKNYSGQISIAISFIKTNGTQEDVGGWKESAAQE